MKNPQSNIYPTALTVAGSDSGGGAGIQADLRTFAAFGVYGCSAITAITAQNPKRVARIDALPAAAVAAQIDAVLETITVSAAKTGMLFSAAIIETVAARLKAAGIPLIVDPVMVSTSGARLLEEDAVAALQEKLLPLATWLTPNVPEAEILSGIKISGRDTMFAAATACAEKWSCSCLLKGGHLDGQQRATDIVVHDGKLYELSSPVITDAAATHGTGCTLSSAMTAALALGFQWKKALRMAKGFVFGSLVEIVRIGREMEAMYPPAECYQEKTKLTRIEQK